MKSITNLVTAGVVVGLTAFAPAVLAQPAAGAQPADPSIQPAPPQQSMPGEEPATELSPSNGPSATTVAPNESPAISAHESPAAPPTGPDARSSVSVAGPTAAPNTRLAAVTPPGMSTEEACKGFRSIRECAAAMHAAQNLSISFGDLKSKLTSGQKLGSAIHGLKPGANAPEEESRAENQARSDVSMPQG